ncbi:MAG: EamA/RhaT family transporter, partial [candidate division KSB1 bacterium]|nr:EamA/RhaT family transporter [candidate division KSB1 bacterium]
MNALQRQSAAVLGFGLLAISSSSILTRLCQAPALTIAFYRVAVASAVYFVLSGARSGAINRSRFKASALAGFFLAVHFAAWITSLSFTSVA